MKYLLSTIFFLMAIHGYSQALRDINYNYLYDPNQPVTLAVKIVKGGDGIKGLYSLHWRDTSSQFSIRWELRNGLGDKEGTGVNTGTADEPAPGLITGTVIVPVPKEPQLLVAKVVNETEKKAWLFYKVIEASYPVNVSLRDGNDDVLESYVSISRAYQVQGNDNPTTVTYYNDNFPSAPPAFAETQARVAKKMAADSIYTLPGSQPVAFPKKGLYLLQHDTSAVEGLAFRSEDDYPRLGRVESLADPLVYVCTKQEFDRIKAVKGDKKAFDKLILGITGDTERARTFMRSYFRRVELANHFFTSYKEGWKTDRGMIYIIFGLPDEVFKFSDREVWSYKNASYKATFNFARSATVFDPDNFVLIRGKKYQDTWYEVIDLWRNARF